MLKTVKAHYRQGRIEPIEPLSLKEGEELEVTVSVADEKPDGDPTASTAGAWAGLLDCVEFEEEVYESRLANPRLAVSQ